MMAEWKCTNCKNYNEDAICARCEDGSEYIKQTNFDNIKTLPEEEAAKLLAEYGFCITRVQCPHLNDETSCTQCITEWLISEAEDN